MNMNTLENEQVTLKTDGGKTHQNMAKLDDALASLNDACKEHRPDAPSYDGTAHYILRSLATLQLIQKAMRHVDESIDAYIASAETKLAEIQRESKK